MSEEKIKLKLQNSDFKFISLNDKKLILETKIEPIYQFEIKFSGLSYLDKLLVTLSSLNQKVIERGHKIFNYEGSRKGKLICHNNHNPYDCLPYLISIGESIEFDDKCKECFDKGDTYRLRQGYKEFKEMVEAKKGTVLEGIFLTKNSKILVRCNDCGKEWKTCHNYLTENQWCYDCKTGTTESKKKFIEMTEKEGYKVLSEYKVVLDKVKMICPKGHDVEKGVGHFLMGSRCRICQGLCPIQAEQQFLDVVEHRGGKVIEKYNGALRKIDIECENKHIFKLTPSSVKRGDWCNICKSSSGESFIMKTLKELSIEYIYQEPINCKGLEKCRYDITCNYKGKKVIFEFDGKQHFEIRIPYYHKNLEEFCYRRNLDREKFFSSLDEKDTRFVRIYYDMIHNLEKFKKFIIDSLNSEQREIFSHPEKYNWIYEEYEDTELIQEYKEKNKDDEKDFEEELTAKEIKERIPYSPMISLKII